VPGYLFSDLQLQSVEYNERLWIGYRREHLPAGHAGEYQLKYGFADANCDSRVCSL